MERDLVQGTCPRASKFRLCAKFAGLDPGHVAAGLAVRRGGLRAAAAPAAGGDPGLPGQLRLEVPHLPGGVRGPGLGLVGWG